MELRDHPIFFTGFGSWWPPVWISTRQGSRHKLRGEVGVLVNTIILESLPHYLFIRMEHEHELFLGSLLVGSQPLCILFHELLQQYIGKSIDEIGALEIGFLL
jgi:hypothetical protein